jgi:hypothetical protein
MSRFEAEVEELAAAILRERKASQPSAVKKVEVALMSGEEGRGGLMSGVDDGDAAAFCRRLLEGLEPELEVAEPPRLSSLTLSGVSPRLLRQHHLQLSPQHHGHLRRGKGHPCSSSPWAYLVYDSAPPTTAPPSTSTIAARVKIRTRGRGKGSGNNSRCVSTWPYFYNLWTGIILMWSGMCPP